MGSAILTLSLYTSAKVAEHVRAGTLAIDTQVKVAALSTGPSILRPCSLHYAGYAENVGSQFLFLRHENTITPCYKIDFINSAPTVPNLVHTSRTVRHGCSQREAKSAA